MRKEFRVVTKAVIFNKDKSRVLVIHMDQNDDYGLPGGHIEENEDMDGAMLRELKEECGITAKELRKVDFFFHSSGKVVLAYAGVSESDHLVSAQGNFEGIPKWVTREEFSNIKIEQNYRKLVLDHWA